MFEDCLIAFVDDQFQVSSATFLTIYLRFSNTTMGFTMASTVRNMVLVIVGGRARSIDGNVAGHRSCYDVLVQ